MEGVAGCRIISIYAAARTHEMSQDGVVQAGVLARSLPVGVEWRAVTVPYVVPVPHCWTAC
jgi:hypothetical protein